MRISLPALVRPGETATVQASLAPGPAGPVKRVFIVHFASDSAFVEPAMRLVLQEAAEYAEKHSEEKIVILGHTDKAGDEAYNQSLSERRARAVFAFLTLGTDRDAALAEWNTLRLERPKGELPSVKDSWGLREAQHMLQDLGFYPGPVNGKESPLLRSAVRAFRCKAGLPPGEQLDEPAWEALVRLYLDQDGFTIVFDAFLPNCPDEILKWLGAGEQDPVKKVGSAHRPNRRVEILFVDAEELPCKVPQPDTFDLPEAGSVGSGWCLGPGEKSKRTCFLFPASPEAGKKPAEGQWERPPAAPAITIEGSILREARKKDGIPVLGDDGKVKLEPVPGGQKFFAIAPDGEIKAGENSSTGEPVPAATNAKGAFTIAGKPPGVYTLTVQGEALARLEDDNDREARGGTVRKLLTAGDRLDVILINAPLLVEIRLPVLVHLLTALDPATHEIRPTLLPENETLPQATTFTEADVREIFDGSAQRPVSINFIWRQARVRFEIRAIVREFFETSGRSGGGVDASELGSLLNDCAPPNVVSVFYAMSLATSSAGQGDGGATVSPESSVAQGLRAGGSSVGQRIRGTFLTVPTNRLLSPEKIVEVSAHELGHFMLGDLSNADHPDPDDPANKGRLMLPSSFTEVSGNTRLTPDEVTSSRSMQAASFGCVPLSLEVAGAVKIGGEPSHRFLALRVDTGNVEVTAKISDELAQTGTVEVRCATAPVNGPQCLVSRQLARTHEVEATYTPAGGGRVVTTRVVVRIVEFTLQLEDMDADVKESAPGRFAARRRDGAVLRIFARVVPSPFAIPEDMIQWSQSSTATADPRRRTVRRDVTGRTVVTATVAGVPKSITLDVFELAFVDEAGKPISEVQIEGILNGSRSAFGRKSLLPSQEKSLFRLRADLPGVPPNQSTVNAELISNPGAGTPESFPFALTRVAKSTVFQSKLLLAIPRSIENLKVTDPDLGVVRARAGGRLRLNVNAAVPLGGFEAQVKVRGRVVHIFAQSFKGAGGSEANIRNHIEQANGIWAQAGIEVRERAIHMNIADPGSLKNFEVGNHNTLTADEELLLGAANKPLNPKTPPRNGQPTDLYVFYVQTLRTLEDDPTPVGVTYSVNEIGPRFNRPTILVEMSTEPKFFFDLAHEIGHMFFYRWGAEHRDKRGVLWPPQNLMHELSVGKGGDLDKTQVENVLDAIQSGENPFVILV